MTDEEVFNNPLKASLVEIGTMSPARSSGGANGTATLDDARGGPPITADPTSFDDPVERALWLEKVLCTSLDMDRDDAKMICGLVIDHFGDKDEVLDEQLPNQVRSVFYTLEKKRILTFRRIEYQNEEGQTLRGFFWRFHEDWQPPEDALTDGDDGDNVYDELPEDCWDRSAAA